MDFRLSSEAMAFREEVQRFLDAAMTTELEEQVYRTGVSHDTDFTKRLVEERLFAPDRPADHGGQDRSVYEAQVLKEELARVDAPLYLSETSRMVASIVEQVGTESMKERIVPGAMRGEVTIALGFSEPSGGSDVAAANTRAVRDGEEWVINGSKMFTTNGHIADYVFLLARTNTEVSKHKGLTMFLVPTGVEGFEAQGVTTLSGERTNITYYSDLRISDEWRIGEVDGGWKVLTLSLDDEHAAGWGPHSARLLHYAEAWAHEPAADGTRPIDDPDVRRRLARVAMDVEVAMLLQRRAVWLSENGRPTGSEGPMCKLFSTETLVQDAQDVYEMIGPDAMRSFFEPSAPQNGRFEHLMRFSVGTTIYAGSSEVQRSIIAQRGLGLPR